MSKKIMFNDRYGLTQAVIDSRKTMTRRIITDEMAIQSLNEQEFMQQLCLNERFVKKYSRYQIGEVVAVAQAYKDIIGDRVFFVSSETGVSVHRSVMEREKGWTNKMNVAAEFMPHRIRITDIKVERLQDISDEDCMKEGIAKWNRGLDLYYYCEEKYSDFNTPREAFADLIDKVSGKGTWDSNPWVFAYSFELVKGGEE